MKFNWKWSAYTFTSAFATYWLVNLLLWYPWSYSTPLGMTLMFVAIPPFWMYSIYDCLKRYSGARLLHGAGYTALIFSFVAVVLDYVFYGIIRGAIAQLYHATTLYGYAFLFVLPFIEIQVFKKRLKPHVDLNNHDFVKYALGGLVSLAVITSIVIFDVRLSAPTFKFVTMILASLIIFLLVIWFVLDSKNFKTKIRPLVLLSILCVVIGMLVGKYGANWGFKWWLYYPIPMLMSVSLPPIILKMATKQTMLYLLLSFLSAPFIHFVFSFLFNWKEYLPFLEIPHFKTLLS